MEQYKVIQSISISREEVINGIPGFVVAIVKAGSVITKDEIKLGTYNGKTNNCQPVKFNYEDVCNMPELFEKL